MSYTVKQLADLAKVSRRTLHYYDQIGLLEPETVAENGYRIYGERAVYQAAADPVLFGSSVSAWTRSARRSSARTSTCCRHLKPSVAGCLGGADAWTASSRPSS